MLSTWEETEKPWTVAITNLELPIPDATALNLEGIAKTFERLRCGVDVDLPARILLESDSLSAAGVHTGLESPSAHVTIAPGNPAELRFDTKLLGWEGAGVHVEAQATSRRRRSSRFAPKGCSNPADSSAPGRRGSL
ncbi:MAG: hypothetical protein HY303_15480 [Candidatus Wallbacteria bacterium]|nr:hypothetical protein [Candidatus Wallbacteria bacterium]